MLGPGLESANESRKTGLDYSNTRPGHEPLLEDLPIPDLKETRIPRDERSPRHAPGRTAR